jgi:hypothetical protein
MGQRKTPASWPRASGAPSERIPIDWKDCRTVPKIICSHEHINNFVSLYTAVLLFVLRQKEVYMKLLKDLGVWPLTIQRGAESSKASGIYAHSYRTLFLPRTTAGMFNA